jgi:hypothetical protein
VILDAVLFDNASDGKHVITAMLVVGLVFVGTVAIGDLIKWWGHRREEQRRRAQTY